MCVVFRPIISTESRTSLLSFTVKPRTYDVPCFEYRFSTLLYSLTTVLLYCAQPNHQDIKTHSGTLLIIHNRAETSKLGFCTISSKDILILFDAERQGSPGQTKQPWTWSFWHWYRLFFSHGWVKESGATSHFHRFLAVVFLTVHIWLLCWRQPVSIYNKLNLPDRSSFKRSCAMWQPQRFGSQL